MASANNEFVNVDENMRSHFSARAPNLLRPMTLNCYDYSSTGPVGLFLSRISRMELGLDESYAQDRHVNLDFVLGFSKRAFPLLLARRTEEVQSSSTRVLYHSIPALCVLSTTN